MQVVIRVDASLRMGTGHVMRCLALAQALQENDINITFVSNIEVPWLLEKISNSNIKIQLLAHDCDLSDSAWFLQQYSGADWIVLDGYHFTCGYQQAVKAAGKKLLVIDDYRHLSEYACDILLNQNIGADLLEYSGYIENRLLGPDYALLRKEFTVARVAAENRLRPEQVKNILISLGGGDFSEHLQDIAPIFEQPSFAGCQIRIIAGSMCSAEIEALFSACSGKVEVLRKVGDMSGLMLDTDLCITAGGSTCWELCCLGVPFLTLQLAENQKLIISNLAQKTIAPVFSAASLAQMMSDKYLREQCRVKAMQLVDGNGISRVIQKIISA